MSLLQSDFVSSFKPAESSLERLQDLRDAAPSYEDLHFCLQPQVDAKGTQIGT